MKKYKLKIGDSREYINSLIGEVLELEDERYLGSEYKHNWKCRCGNSFIRMYHTIRNGHTDCGCKERNKSEKKYKEEVEKDYEYKYIRCYHTKDVLPNNKISNTPMIEVVHKYCGNRYIVKASSFINIGQRCNKCCQKYENSFAHHIEVELGLKLEDVWDFEKNTLNPYHIYKNSKNKIWIKCQEKDYHGSYEIMATQFKCGSRCVYCRAFKVHPKDSFAQYHIDNTDPNFLEKYWDYEKIKFLHGR